MNTEADIVERLRALRSGTPIEVACEADEMCQLAAIEITKLRAERDARCDHLVEALEVISEQYENGRVNHVDFRVHAKMTADAALEAYRATMVIATDRVTNDGL